ncbi:hypothetical protein CYY_005100 [Polysphondylium violaceum]|uniref:G domain-containing protein n=1 Tax=Polysphondylium violaceum TaxID=133409 RepID=A0A8J4PTH8_9MYCE|nr:hypothetical protein CYY_005100 [Polysphondylium violaceum]
MSKTTTTTTTTTSTAKQSSNNTVSILVIGETGCGKSTFINTNTNYFLDGTLENLKVAITTKHLKATENFKNDELSSGDRTKSQTDSCNNYTFTKDNTTYVFIDTPGLSDTRGIKQDDINIDKIIDAAEKAKSLSAIILLINGTVPRMTINLQNALSRLRGSIPDSLLNNIFLVLTNCLNCDKNFDLDSIQINIKPSNIFFMNNSAFSTNPTTWDENSKEYLNFQLQLSFKTITKLLTLIKETEAVPTRDFSEMKIHRSKIKSTLHKATLDIGNLQKLQDNLAIYEAQLEKHNKDKESFKNFTKKNTVTKKQLVPATYHSTICSTCNHVCHDHCGLTETTEKGANIFIGCYCMGGTQNCQICESKCSFTVHYHDKKTMKDVTTTVEEELKDLKDKYMKSINDAHIANNHINSLSDAKKITDAALNKMTQEIVDSCKKLKKLCSGFNLVDELNITLNQMEMEAKKHTSMDARKSADQMIRVIREIVDKLNSEAELKSKKENVKIDETMIEKITISNQKGKNADKDQKPKGPKGQDTKDKSDSKQGPPKNKDNKNKDHNNKNNDNKDHNIKNKDNKFKDKSKENNDNGNKARANNNNNNNKVKDYNKNNDNKVKHNNNNNNNDNKVKDNNKNNDNKVKDKPPKKPQPQENKIAGDSDEENGEQNSSTGEAKSTKKKWKGHKQYKNEKAKKNGPMAAQE